MINYFITGITGQDGIFLTKKLLEENKNLHIYGSTRQTKNPNFYNKLSTICSFDNSRITLINIDLCDRNMVMNFLTDVRPAQIYNMSGPSSVYKSYKKPTKARYEIETIFDNLTKSLVKLKFFPKLFQASSSEMFGPLSHSSLTEEDLLEPISPYAKAKLANHKKVDSLRQKYDWEIYSGILFNHESQFRNDNYLLKKIINSAKQISEKKEKKITLGSLDYQRDWTFAEDTVEAILKITNSNTKQDFVIGSGEIHSINEMANVVFEYFNLELEKYVHIDSNLLRTNDPIVVGSSPNKLIALTEWKKVTSFENMIYKTIEG
jgi:GDPmannose 4,6-dehydratase